MAFVRTIRKRFFLAVEGESEQSFVKWVQNLADDSGLDVHLQCYVLAGGGYSSMLRDAAKRKAREENRKDRFKAAFLLLDEDRAQQPQPDWPIERLRSQAASKGLIFCGQRPKFEGLLLRMLPGRERTILSAASVDAQLPILLPGYRKPIDALYLAQKFTVDDLLRAAAVEPDLKQVLSMIGFLRRVALAARRAEGSA